MASKEEAFPSPGEYVPPSRSCGLIPGNSSGRTTCRSSCATGMLQTRSDRSQPGQQGFRGTHTKSVCALITPNLAKLEPRCRSVFRPCRYRCPDPCRPPSIQSRSTRIATTIATRIPEADRRAMAPVSDDVGLKDGDDGCPRPLQRMLDQWSCI